jgi:hypothetical protein
LSPNRVQRSARENQEFETDGPSAHGSTAAFCAKIMIITALTAKE